MKLLTNTRVLIPVIIVLGIVAFNNVRNYVNSTPIVGQKINDLGYEHVSDTTNIKYNSNPPTSGPHKNAGIRAGVYYTVSSIPYSYDSIQKDEYLLHSMEYGYVILWYKCDGVGTDLEADPSILAYEGECRERLEKLSKIFIDKGQSKLIVMGRGNLTTNYALTAWNRIDIFNDFDEKRIISFIDANRNQGIVKTDDFALAIDTNGIRKRVETKHAANFAGSVPEDGFVYAEAPLNIVVNFDKSISSASTLNVTRDGKEYTNGSISFEDGITMRKKINSTIPDGTFTVKYNECSLEKQCEQGVFQFKIDRKQALKYTDLKAKKVVSLSIKGGKYIPQDIIVSKGAKITWVNKDTLSHSVNTVNHKSHNYFPSMNSQNLNTGGSYTISFDKNGVYPYHCNIHDEEGNGNIIVQ